MSQSDLPAHPDKHPRGTELTGAENRVHERFLERGQPTMGWLATLAVAAGLLGGVGAWLIGELAVHAFRPPLARIEVMGQVLFKATFEDQTAADFKNATLAFAGLGGVLGLALGVAGGLARHNLAAGLKAGGFGLVLGGLLGAGASLVLLPVYFRSLDLSPEALSRDMMLPLLVHGGIWGACGLAGGVAFGIGFGGRREQVINAAVGGLIGAILGAAAYEVIGALVFSTAKTTSPVSLTGSTRLLARLLVATLTGLVAAAVINLPGKRLPAHETSA